MTPGTAGHGLVGLVDTAAFLARLTRLDPAAPVRLRSAGGGRYTELWAHLPWGVLVTRRVAGTGPGDVTVDAADLLAEVARSGPALPGQRDARWRWALPPAAGQVVVETVDAGQLRRLALAAAGTLRSAVEEGVAGQRVGERAVRDALLDHVALVVTEPIAPGTVERIEVSQRLVQAVVRMGFLGPDGPARPPAQVRTVGRWVGVSAPFGAVWLRKVDNLTVRPIPAHTNG